MEDWRAIRIRVLRRDAFRCRSCKKPTLGQVHHIVPSGLGGSSRLSNLITLCGKCHMLVSPVPDWVIRKVWKIREEEIPVVRQQVQDCIAKYCLQRVRSNENPRLDSSNSDRETSRGRLAEQIRWLNSYLSLVYNSEIRVSTALTNLGFNETQLRIIRNQHLEQFVNSIVASISDRLLAYTDGERLFVIFSRRLKIDGAAADTLQSLGERFGISRERVRQLEVKALRRCRHKTNKEFLESTLRELANVMLEHSKGLETNMRRRS